MKQIKKIAVVGPVYPYYSGIAHYTGLLVTALKKKYEVVTYSYSMQYPKFMFKREQKDYGNRTFEIKDAKFKINTALPHNWISSRKLLLKEKPDLMIVQWWHPYFAPCYQTMLSGLKKHFPVIFVCHNVLPHERFPFDRLLSKNTLSKGYFCILHSKEDEKDLKGLLPSMQYKRTVLPTYNAFKLSGIGRKDAREQLGVSDDEQMILFFGLVRKYKGLKYLILAAGKIVEHLPKAKIFIVGDFGSDKDEYMELIEKSGVKDHFVIRDGYVPDKEVEPYFAAADVNVCPYISATQSAIVQIAFGFEMPVIATDVGGLPEAVTDGRTGLIVPHADPDALANAVIRYFDEDLKTVFSENVKNEAERFSWDRTVEIVEEFYDRY